MELVWQRLVDNIEGERLVAGRLHHEFEPRGYEDGDVLLQLRRIATGRNLSLSSENVINLLLSLELRGRCPGSRRQPAISKKVGGVQDRALLRGSEIIAAGKNVTQDQRAVLEPGHRTLPIADKHIDSPVVRLSVRRILDELRPGIRIDSIDRVFR